jgi:hypothetical protein
MALKETARRASSSFLGHPLARVERARHPLGRVADAAHRHEGGVRDERASAGRQHYAGQRDEEQDQPQPTQLAVDAVERSGDLERGFISNANSQDARMDTTDRRIGEEGSALTRRDGTRSRVDRYGAALNRRTKDVALRRDDLEPLSLPELQRRKAPKQIARTGRRTDPAALDGSGTLVEPIVYVSQQVGAHREVDGDRRQCDRKGHHRGGSQSESDAQAHSSRST